MGAQFWRLTSADEAKTYSGYQYTPESITRTSTSQGSELASGSIKVSLPKEHPIALLFQQYLPPSPLFLTIFRAHDADPDTVVIFNGKVTLSTLADFCELTCAPEQETLKKIIPASRYQKPCNRILYDTGCGVDQELFKLTGTLTSVVANVIQSSVFATKPNGWLNSGRLEKGNGRRMIVQHVGSTVTLLEPLPGLAVGDTVSAFAGCMRDYPTCQTKFANGAHFFGFGWIPGKNPFATGVG
jgi:uncharacterized phage protein (TIGR02218 family)